MIWNFSWSGRVFRGRRNRRALWLWGLIGCGCGAIGLLVRGAEVRGAIAEAIELVRILSVPQKEMKAIEMNGKEMLV